MRQNLKDSFIEKYSIKLKDAVFELILELNNEEFKQTTRASLVNTVELISSILNVSMRGEHVGEITEKFQLEISLKCFQSPSLEKRLQGLQVINSLIAMTYRKENAIKGQSGMNYYGGSGGNTGYHHMMGSGSGSNSSMGMGQYGNSSMMSTGSSMGSSAGQHQSLSRIMLPTKWLTSNEMLDWMKRNKIIDSLFGVNLHQELLKRSNDLFKFLAFKKEFKISHINLLWDSSIGKQEAVTSAIYKIFKDLVKENIFTKEYLNHLINKIKELPIKEYDINLISLIQDIDESCLYKQQQQQQQQAASGSSTPSQGMIELDTRGYVILWKVIQDDSGASEEVLLSAIKAIEDIIEKIKFSANRGTPGAEQLFLEIRNYIIQNTITSIKHHKSTLQSYEILKKLISVYPRQTNQSLMSKQEQLQGMFTRNQLVMSINAKYDLTKLFIEDLVDYQEKLVSYVKNEREQDGNLNSESFDKKINETPIISKYYSHSEQIKRRLDFLSFIMGENHELINTVYLSTLWELIIEQSLTEKVKNTGFEWFSFLCENLIFPKEILKEFFESKLKNQNFEEINKAGFECFDHYFKLINRELGKLSLLNNPSSSAGMHYSSSLSSRTKEISVQDINLLGIDCFWDIALLCRNNDIAFDAIYYLSNLYDYLSPNLQLQSGNLLREKFIEKIMEKIGQLSNIRNSGNIQSLNELSLSSSQSMKTISISSTEFTIERCLILLEEFLDHCDPLLDTQTRKRQSQFLTSIEKQEKIKVVFIYEASTCKKYEIKSTKLSTLAQLKGKLLKKLNFSTDKVDCQFQFNNKIIQGKELNYPIKYLGIKDRSVVLFKLHAVSMQQRQQMQLQQQQQQTQSSLRSFLSNDKKSFEQLFNLLDFNEFMGEKVWKLITGLPLNPNLFEKLKNQSESTEWNEELINTKSTLKLLYSLQIINLIINSNGSPQSSQQQVSEQLEAQKQWKIKFIKNGGFKYLFEILLNYKDIIKGKLAKQCLVALFKIINSFLLTRSSQSGSPTTSHSEESYKKQKQKSKRAEEEDEDDEEDDEDDDEEEDQLNKSNGDDDYDTIRTAYSSSSPFILNDQLLNSLEWIQWNNIIYPLMDLIWESGKDTVPRSSSSNQTQQQQGNTIHGQLVNHATSLLIAFLLSDNKVSKYQKIEYFFKYENLKEFLHCLLLDTSEKSIRIKTREGILELSSLLSFSSSHSSGETGENAFNVRSLFLRILISFLPSIQANSQFCVQYFHLTGELLEEKCKRMEEDNSSDENALNLNKLVDDLIELIQKHPTVEIEENGLVDLVLIGLFKLLGTIIKEKIELKQIVAKKLMKHLFVECLFELPSAGGIEITQEEFVKSQADLQQSTSLLESGAGLIPPPKCKTEKACRGAFELLKLLSDGDDSVLNKQLILINNNHLDKDECKYLDWNYSPVAEQRSKVGYVGIKNLGCICYMNSLLQQLFMMPAFRRGILSLYPPIHQLIQQQNQKNSPPSPEADDQPTDPQSIIQDSLIYQIQAMFSFLQESKKQYYDPSNFCKANKDYDGQPTDVSIQMDVDEFFNMLCEKVEEGLKQSTQAKLLKNIWCGNLCSQLVCKECNYISERDEAFFTVSLDIKNKTSINEALDFYVQGEMLTGGDAYFCSKCNKKVDALMRRCLKNLPSTLILHLKRFEFNFDTMRKVKLNDYCEFPRTLNMKPFTKEGILAKEREEAEAQKRKLQLEKQEKQKSADDKSPEGNESKEDEEKQGKEDDEKQGKEDEEEKGRKEGEAGKGGEEEEAGKNKEEEIKEEDYYNYQLVGILVHRGVADSGHYYSFIKLRNSNKTNEDQWIEFNDEIVRPFDISNIDKECFGGKEEIAMNELGGGGNVSSGAGGMNRGQGGNMGISGFNKQINRTRNAYMLIYERVNCNYNELNQSPIQTQQPANEESKSPMNDHSNEDQTSEDQESSYDDHLDDEKLILSQKVEESFQVAIPKRLYNQVWQENYQFLMDKKLFDPNYANFCLDLLSVDSKSNKANEKYERLPVQNFLSIATATNFLLKILTHSKERVIFEKFIEELKNEYSRNIPACIWFVESICRGSLLKELLLMCASPEVRIGIAELISLSIRKLIKFEGKFFSESRSHQRMEKFNNDSSDSDESEDSFDTDDSDSEDSENLPDYDEVTFAPTFPSFFPFPFPPYSLFSLSPFPIHHLLYYPHMEEF